MEGDLRFPVTVRSNEHCYLLASRMISSHTKELAMCMEGPQAPLPASSLCSEAQGDWSPLVAHPMPLGRGLGVCWANAFGFVSRKYHSSPIYFGTLRLPCSSLCFLHTTKMWSRVWRGTPHSHRWDSSILNRWKYDPIGACPSIDRHMRVKTDKRPLTSPSQAPPLA